MAVWIFSCVATTCAGLFAGAAVYVSLVEHPARLSCGGSVALAEFAPSYRRGAILQTILAASAFFSSLFVWISIGHAAWLFGGLALLFAVAFTLLVIFPVNKRLLDPSLNPDSENARHLLVKWGRMHLVRSFAGLGAFVTFLLNLSQAHPFR